MKNINIMVYILTCEERRYCYIGFDNNEQTIEQILEVFVKYNPSIEEYLVLDEANEEDALSLSLLFKDQEHCPGWYKSEKILEFLGKYDRLDLLRKELPHTKANLSPQDIDQGMVNSIMEFCEVNSQEDLVISMVNQGIATGDSFKLFLSHDFPEKDQLIYEFWEGRKGKWSADDIITYSKIKDLVKGISSKAELYKYLCTIDLPFIGLLEKDGLYEAKVVVTLGKRRVRGNPDPEYDYELRQIDQVALEEEIRNSFKLWSCYTNQEIENIFCGIKRRLEISPKIHLNINKYFSFENTKVRRPGTRHFQSAKILCDWLGDEPNAESSFKKELFKLFPIGDKMPVTVARNRLNYLYSKVQGFTKTAKATDLSRWFVVKYCWVDKLYRGVEIKAKLGDPSPQNFIDILKPLVLEKFKYQTKASTASIMVFLDQLFQGCGYWRKPKIKYIKYWYPNSKKCMVLGKPGYKFNK